MRFEPASPRKLPAAVVRGRELADLVRGRDLLFKCKRYMGPVHVDDASCSYRWFRLEMTTHPWLASATSGSIKWMVPPGGVTKTAVQISIRAHDMVGMLIHDPMHIERIETLRKGGATGQQLVMAFNAGLRLPVRYEGD